MIRKNDNKLLREWIEEIWEEIEVQFYGVTGAILFFFLIYILFHPSWMKNFINYIA
tara:strand:+ start:524 stop:691 length:168 start_codon:yes stop_codon:yes gene_type:complete